MPVKRKERVSSKNWPNEEGKEKKNIARRKVIIGNVSILLQRKV